MANDVGGDVTRLMDGSESVDVEIENVSSGSPPTTFLISGWRRLQMRRILTVEQERGGYEGELDGPVDFRIQNEVSLRCQ